MMTTRSSWFSDDLVRTFVAVGVVFFLISLLREIVKDLRDFEGKSGELVASG